MLKKTVLSAFCMTATMALSSFAMAQHDAHNNAHGDAHHGPAEMKDSASDLVASQCWARLADADRASALYFTIENKDEKQTAYLVSASSPAFHDVMLHESYEENGMAGMRHLAEVEVAPKSTLEFKPGSYHVMMEKPQDGLKVGDKVDFEIGLSNGHKIPMNCVMKPISSRTFED